MPGKSYKTSEEVDFVIVGSGAAGGVLARELSQAGHSVVVMERGPYMKQGDFHHDELAYWFANELMQANGVPPQSFRHSADEETDFHPDYPNMLYAQCVGGSSVHFTANYWRFHPVDFQEQTVHGDIPGAALADWPISYEELELYYTKVEWEIGVSGLAGAHPNEPHRSKPYPMPPLPVKSSGVLFEKGAFELGLNPFPAPMAINSAPYDGRAACVHCGFCMGFGCEMGAKSSTLFNMIPQAEATGVCEIRTGANVVRVDTNKQGRATGVIYYDLQGRQHLQKAKAVVLSANGAETARLLFLSENSRFADGLANSSGIVGRHMMFNGGGIAGAFYEHPLNEYKSVQVTRICHDFYDTDPKRGFYGGGGIDARVMWSPIAYAVIGGMPSDPGWGPEHKDYLRQYPNFMYSSTHSTSLPVETNRVELDPEHLDSYGLPGIRLTYTDHADDLATTRFLVDRAAEILEASGAKTIWKHPAEPQSFTAHLLGTCRMGNDPATSVVDKYHRTHDVPNLFICDGSSLVTSGRGQPTQTIQALAFRAAEHISRFAKNGEI